MFILELNVGIIGCGSIARFRHAPEYRANPYVKDIFFYDRNIERSERLAKEFDGVAIEKLEDLLANPLIIAISDCSSNEVHHIHTTQALLSGKHVLCEKPMANNVELAQKIQEAEHQSGKKLMIDHNQRFTKAHQKAKEIIKSKELGEVLSFRTTFGHQGPESWGVTKSSDTWFFKKERSHGGVITDLGIHKIDLIHYLLNDEISEVHAFHDTLDKVDENGVSIEVPDNAVCILKTEKGKLGTASFSWTYYSAEDNSTTIYCQDGMIKIYHDPEAQLIVERNDGTRIIHELGQIQTNDHQYNSGVIDAFIDCIIHDKEPPVTSKDAISSLKVIDKILMS